MTELLKERNKTMECHGCFGRGWVDSQWMGPTKCPVCEGVGWFPSINTTKIPDPPPIPSKDTDTGMRTCAG